MTSTPTTATQQLRFACPDCGRALSRKPNYLCRKCADAYQETKSHLVNIQAERLILSMFQHAEPELFVKMILAANEPRLDGLCERLRDAGGLTEETIQNTRADLVKRMHKQLQAIGLVQVSEKPHGK